MHLTVWAQEVCAENARIAEGSWMPSSPGTLILYLNSINTLTCLWTAMCFSFNRKEAAGGNQSELCQNPEAAGPWSHRHCGIPIHEASVSPAAIQLISSRASYHVLYFLNIAMCRCSRASYAMTVFVPFNLYIAPLLFPPSAEIWTELLDIHLSGVSSVLSYAPAPAVSFKGY